MKTHKKNKGILVFLSSFAVLLGLQDAFAQSTATIKYSVSYTQTISTAYEVNLADRSRLLEFEKAGLKPTTEVRNVTMLVDHNNDLTTTINIISSNVSESWMTPPSKIVIDKNGIKMYNAQNVILTQDAYTPAQNEDYLATKNDIAQNGLRALPQFQALSPTNISALQQQGFSVQALAGGVIQARKGSTEIKYNNAEMSYEVTEYEGAKALSQDAFKYRNEGGKTIPEAKTERSYQTTQNGVCIARVTHTVFSNYQPIGLP